MVYRAIILICLCFALTPVLHAQTTEPPTPAVEGFITRWTTENVYPMGMRFTVTAGLPPDQLSSAALTLAIPGTTPREISVDVTAPVGFTQVDTLLEYVWRFDAASTPALFDTISYSWRIASNGGEIASLSDQLLFRDDRIQWTTATDPQGFITITAPEDGIDLPRLERDLLLVYNLIAANVDQTHEFNILLYPPDVPVSGCEITEDGDLFALGAVTEYGIPCDPDQAAAIISDSGYALIQPDGPGLNDARTALVSHFVAQVYAPIWANADVPDWFRAGLTDFYQPDPKTALFGPVLTAARRDGFYDLAAMNTQRDDPLWRAQSYAMVLYVADQLGVPGLFELATTIGEAESFAAAYEATSGQPLRGLIPAMSRWLLTTAGEVAFRYTPYQPVTPTPSATPSQTPFPPTPTFTPTITDTPTPSPTVTGVLSPTPAPTRTPTRTPTAAPPSITPRPPGSLNTPVPQSTLVTLADDNTRLIVLGILGILLVGTLILLFQTREKS